VKRTRASVCLLFLILIIDATPAQTVPGDACATCIRAHMEFLASDALRGRGSGTHDELVAATYIAAQLRQYGIEPAAGNNGYLQRVELVRRELTGSPALTAADGGRKLRFTHRSQLWFIRLSGDPVSGPLQKMDAASPAPATRGAVVLVKLAPEASTNQAFSIAFPLIEQGAAVVLFTETPALRKSADSIRTPAINQRISGIPEGVQRAQNIAVLGAEAAAALGALEDGTSISLDVKTKLLSPTYTWNVVGKLTGADPQRTSEAVLLSAHLDHVGVRGDKIYYGADDDASGTTAVLELARVLAAGPRPARTVLFALFGSEERGGHGSMYFREAPPVPLENIVANLQVEMIGRPDKAVPPDMLWLTGYDRSNLGPELVARGAKLVADPHPRQDFFRRSDNYMLARRGVVAHTISSFGLHKQYHQPDDNLAHIDFAHMTRAIESMVEPVKWLVNSDFRPEWVEGRRP
jgi:Zn-dependent M28 family amino/carboxypeptidase